MDGSDHPLCYTSQGGSFFSLSPGILGDKRQTEMTRGWMDSSSSGAAAREVKLRSELSRNSPVRGTALKPQRPDLIGGELRISRALGRLRLDGGTGTDVVVRKAPFLGSGDYHFIPRHAFRAAIVNRARDAVLQKKANAFRHVSRPGRKASKDVVQLDRCALA